ncbi:sigma factor-like helix-turn-helix DNA-binding protein [Streptomyces sp. NPDC057837]|uniref:sigma factor-like helix-turn-helix DNA-binding protein n=1 Tax=Streptomyces sp. NPDC057837 TaxID=3346260 RepID=UPI003685928A
MPPSKAKQASVAQRRREMLIMKIQGRTALEIAEHFDMSPNTARSDLSRAIKKARDLEVHEAETYRFIQGARLEELLRAVWPAATDPVDVDLKASEQARKLIADITDLFGLKIPVRTEISGPDGGAIPFGGNDLAELSALIDIADQENAELPVLPDRTGDEDEDQDDEDEDADRD